VRTHWRDRRCGRSWSGCAARCRLGPTSGRGPSAWCAWRPRAARGCGRAATRSTARRAPPSWCGAGTAARRAALRWSGTRRGPSTRPTPPPDAMAAHPSDGGIQALSGRNAAHRVMGRFGRSDTPYPSHFATPTVTPYEDSTHPPTHLIKKGLIPLRAAPAIVHFILGLLRSCDPPLPCCRDPGLARPARVRPGTVMKPSLSASARPALACAVRLARPTMKAVTGGSGHDAARAALRLLAPWLRAGPPLQVAACPCIRFGSHHHARSRHLP
jgi:hypothetical protein